MNELLYNEDIKNEGVFILALEFKAETVQLDIKERVATIELNRPDSLNSLNVQVLKEFSQVLQKVKEIDSVDILVISGNGKAFCAGGDIRMMLEASTIEEFELVMDYISSMMITLYTMPKIVIGALHGAAAGLGLSLALACDYIIAHKETKIAMNFIGIGLMPDGGSHYLMEKRLGEDHAKQLIFNGTMMLASEALSLGLVNEVVEDLEQRVKEYVMGLHHRPIRAMIGTKEIFIRKNKQDFIQVLEWEKELQTKMRQTKDHQEGIEAFIAKRRPNFEGK